MKLMTKELEEIFEKYPIGSQDGLGGNAKVIAKFFNPVGAGTWLITEAEKTEDGDYEMFGYCHLGDDEMAELGYVMLSQLEELTLPFGLKVERDMYMPKDCNLIQTMKSTGITPPSYMLEEYQEKIYERVCDKYISMNINQFILQDEGKIKLVDVKKEYVKEAELGVIPVEKYRDYIENETIYESYKELFKDTEMNEGIEIDLEDMQDSLYDEKGNWTYAISKEDILELQSFGEKIDLSLLEPNKDIVDELFD